MIFMLYSDQKILVSDTSDKELISFAKIIGCNISQFKRGIIHRFILTDKQGEDALVYGAQYLNRRKLIKKVYKPVQLKIWFPRKGVKNENYPDIKIYK